MKLYVGNCQSKFDCDTLINQLKQWTVEPSHGHIDLDPTNLFYNEYLSQTDMLKNAGYNNNTVEYRHYKAGRHFDLDYAQKLGEIVGCTPMVCWISEVHPGKCVPWHWDINAREEEQQKQGNLVRYFAFLSKPQPGHIFVTEHDAYYNEPQGAIYQYSHVHAWHAGSNVGLTPKYLLTLTGVQ